MASRDARRRSGRLCPACVRPVARLQRIAPHAKGRRLTRAIQRGDAGVLAVGAANPSRGLGFRTVQTKGGGNNVTLTELAVEKG